MRRVSLNSQGPKLRRILPPDRCPSGLVGLPFVVFAALLVHAARGFEDVLRIEAAEGAGLENLIYGVLRDHHPLRRVPHRQRLVERAIDKPDEPSPRTRTGQKTQRLYLSSDC